jgi:tetratricopeptide (TPR) repeat protein
MKNFVLLFSIIILLTGCNNNGGAGINPLPNFDVMWDYSNPDSTEIRFKEILPLLQNTSEFDIDADYHPQLLTQIARAQGLQGKFHEADSTLKEADKIITEDMPIAKIRYLLEKGRLFNSLGDKEQARPLFLEAYEYGLIKNLDLYTVDAAHMMGIVEPEAKQLDWSLMALEVAEKSEDERCKGWLGALYNNIGWTFFDLQKYEDALKIHLKGYEWRKEQGDAETTRIAKWSVARMLRALEKYDDALTMQQEILQELGENQLPADGYVYEELAELNWQRGNTVEAKGYFAQAYELLLMDSWLVKNEPERINRLRKMGN